MGNNSSGYVQTKISPTKESLTKTLYIRSIVVAKVLITFGFAPVVLLLSWFQSTCRDGPPDYVYIVLGLQIAFTGFQIRLALSSFRPPEGWNFPLPLEASVEDYLYRGFTVVSSMAKLSEKDSRTTFDRLQSFWPALTFLALVDVSDFTTDLLLPGQLKACETPERTRLYTQTWAGWGFLKIVVHRIHLSGLITVFIVLTSIVQACAVMYHLWLSWDIHEVESSFDVKDEASCDRLTKCWTNFAVATGGSGGHVIGKIYSEALARIPTKTTRAAAIELSSPPASPRGGRDGKEKEDSVSKLLGARPLMRTSMVEVAEAIGDEQRGRKLAVFYRGVVMRILLEAAPSMLGATAVFVEGMDGMAPGSLAKTIFTLALSALTCSHAAAKCLKFALQKRYDAAIVGFLILCLIFMAVVKIVYAFICPHHFFHVFGWHCAHLNGRGNDATQ